MAEEIVACPGCAKKFRIPEGAPPGTFPCTACGVSVPYGAKAAARPAAKSAQVPARPAAPQRAAPQRASAAQTAPSRSRRPARDDYDEAPKKSNMGLIWAGIGVGGVVLIGLVYWLTKPDDSAPPAKSPAASAAPTATTPAAAAAAATSKPTEQPKPAATTPEPTKPAEQPKPTTSAPPTDTHPNAPAASSPTAAAATPPKTDDTPKPAAPKGDFASLGQTFASVSGVTADERAALDKYVALAMDQGSAKDGAEAEGKLVHAGKKAIPSILTAFGKQSTGGKWASDSDQWSADKLQDLLHRIAGSDGLNPDFYPRFMSGAPPEDFQKAATMWINWWNSKGQFKDKYKRND